MDNESKPWSAADAWFSPGRFAVLLGLLIFLAYPGVVLGWQTFVFRDFGLFNYPVAFYFRESFWRGELPLWNPLSNCGIPFLAQWGNLILYPPSLFYLIFPLSWALGVFNLLHQWLAGVGMYYLAMRWTGNRLGASVAGLTYAFNGFTLNCLMWPHYMVAVGLAPWVILTVERAWQEGGRWIPLAAIAGALQMLGGAPETILFTWMILGGLLVIQWFERPKPEEGNAQQPEEGSPQPARIFPSPATPAWMTFRFMLVVFLVAGLAAAQLLPFFDLVPYSQRHATFARSHWSMPGTGWANFLVPLFQCFQTPSGVCFEYEQYVTSSYYAGIGTVALVIAALWYVRRIRVWYLGVVVLLALIMALGDDGYLFGWLYQIIPGMGFVRYPIKYVIPALIVMPLLAAFAVADFNAKNRRLDHYVTWTGLYLVALMGFCVWFSYYFPQLGEN